MLVLYTKLVLQLFESLGVFDRVVNTRWIDTGAMLFVLYIIDSLRMYSYLLTLIQAAVCEFQIVILIVLSFLSVQSRALLSGPGPSSPLTLPHHRSHVQTPCLPD